MWLTAQGIRPRGAGASPAESTAPEWLVELDRANGKVVAVSPPGTLGDQPLQWPFAPTRYGTDAPAWPTPG
jgi:hypothetical protein